MNTTGSSPFTLPDLGFSKDALQPHLSAETLEFHHGKHHQGYVNKLNGLVEGTVFEKASLETIVRLASGGIFNNAAQHYNHSFYWQCLAPAGAQKPSAALESAITRSFGSVESFQKAFTAQATGLFGSGWCWLVRGDDGALSIKATPNAGCPIQAGEHPILTCDVWEHAYYIDYRNARPGYVGAFWKIVNWEFVSQRFEA